MNCKISLLLVLSAFTLVLGPARIRADVVFQPDPTASTASSSFSSDIPAWGPQNLYDGTPTEADLDTNLGAAIAGADYAGIGFGPHVVVYEFGSSISFNSIAYAQRNGNGGLGPNTDRVLNIDVWATDTDPGPATVDLPATLGPAQANTGDLDQTQDARNFRNYSLGATLTGRYVIMQLNDVGDTSAFNPGGTELQIAFDTAPPDPNLTSPSVFAFDPVEADEATASGQFSVSNIGATEVLNIPEIALTGPDAARFSILSFPLTLAPGESGDVVVHYATAGEVGNFSAVATITSNDSLNTEVLVNLSISVVPPVPDDLEFLSDPVAASASTFFNENFGPENLFDGAPALTDLNTQFLGDADYAGVGGGPHVVVFDYGAPVTFSAVVYAQRGGNLQPGVDKVENMEIWVTNTDPGPAALDLPILSEPADANTGQLDTESQVNMNRFLRLYDLGDFLTGRYVIFRLNDDMDNVFNPGGGELQLALSGTPRIFQILSVEYDGISPPVITWTSQAGISYLLERSGTLDNWIELEDSIEGQKDSTSFPDEVPLPVGTTRMYYRVTLAP